MDFDLGRRLLGRDQHEVCRFASAEVVCNTASGTRVKGGAGFRGDILRRKILGRGRPKFGLVDWNVSTHAMGTCEAF